MMPTYTPEQSLLAAAAAPEPNWLAGLVAAPYMPHSEPLLKYGSLDTAMWRTSQFGSA